MDEGDLRPGLGPPRPHATSQQRAGVGQAEAALALPVEVWTKILGDLPDIDVHAFASTCKLLRRAQVSRRSTGGRGSKRTWP